MDMGATGGMPELASVGLWAAFLLGLTAGFGHCLVMCGPLVSAASLAEGCGGCRPEGAGQRALRFQLGYHSGRLITYALIGAILGLLGEAGALSGLTSAAQLGSVSVWVKAAAGVSMLVVGVALLVGALSGRGVRLPEPTRVLAESRWFAETTQSLLKRGPRWGLALGMMMGLLPCMPLLPAELAALASGKPLWGALTMLAFGLGTIPALAGVGAASGLVGARTREAATLATSVVVIALGAIVTWQGLALALGA
jgi:sulfite exporter TauE/SafE